MYTRAYTAIVACYLIRDTTVLPIHYIYIYYIYIIYTTHIYIGFVVSFGGALIGSMLIYTLPALMNLKNIERFGLRPKTGLPLEVCTCDVE